MEGELSTDLGQCFEDPDLGFIAYSTDLGPCCTNVGHIQTLAKVSATIPTIVPDQVDLYKSRQVLVPFREGSHWNLMFEQGTGLGAGSAFERLLVALWSQQPVYGCRTDLE